MSISTQEKVFFPKYDIEQMDNFPSKKDFYQNYVYSNTPVIITKELKSKKKWTFDWLKENVGYINIDVGHGQLQKDIKDFTKRNTTLQEFIDAIFSDSGEQDYLGAIDLTKLVPSLKQRVEPHHYYRHKKLQKINFFVGPGDTISQLHCDYAENIFSQMVGKKRIQLYSPKSKLLKYKMHETFTSCYNSLESEIVNEEQRAILTYPDYDFIIEKEQILYIPYGWWHRVTSLEPSISIAQWWMDYLQLLSRVCWTIKDFVINKYR